MSRQMKVKIIIETRSFQDFTLLLAAVVIALQLYFIRNSFDGESKMNLLKLALIGFVFVVAAEVRLAAAEARVAGSKVVKKKTISNGSEQVTGLPVDNSVAFNGKLTRPPHTYFAINAARPNCEMVHSLSVYFRHVLMLRFS